MEKTSDYSEVVCILSEKLEKRGLMPVLVGGMALVILGSQRITKDFDFLVSREEDEVSDLVEVFYEQGFELVSKFNDRREVVRTIDNKNIAGVRLKLDSPTSAYFFNPKTRLKIDLLFDFPLSAKEVASRSIRVKIRSHSLRVASREDLLRLKEIAYADRHSAADAQDLEFLRGLIQSKKKS